MGVKSTKQHLRQPDRACLGPASNTLAVSIHSGDSLDAGIDSNNLTERLASASKVISPIDTMQVAATTTSRHGRFCAVQDMNASSLEVKRQWVSNVAGCRPQASPDDNAKETGDCGDGRAEELLENREVTELRNTRYTYG